MRVAVDQDAFEEGYLQLAIDPEGDDVPESIELPGGNRAEIVKSESIETADGKPVYELKYEGEQE
jgi:hypothetical protein